MDEFFGLLGGVWDFLVGLFEFLDFTSWSDSPKPEAPVEPKPEEPA